MTDEYYPPYQQQPASIEERISEAAYPMGEQSFLKARIEVAEIIEALKNSLMGRMKNSKGDWVEVGEPLLNETGANRLTSIVNFYVNTNTIFGELQREDIDNICYGLSFDIKQALVANEREWGVKDFMLTKRAVIDFVFITLTRAQHRGEAESIGRLTSVRTVVERPEAKRGSRLNFFGDKGGKE